VSFHTFLRERVDTTIFETHSGGEYDATNIIQKPIVTGITTLGMDHVEMLGPSIEDIAWNKAGIFKAGSPAYSVLQEPAATKVLRRRAVEKGVTLEFVTVSPALPANAKAIKPEVQRINCSLALQVVKAFLEQMECRSLTSRDILQGVDQFDFPGRFHQVTDGTHQWYLDGAHNELSVEKAAQWFAETISEQDR
jgi:folylpolyglutamate synthase